MATLAKATGKGRARVLTGLGVSLTLGLLVVAALAFMLPLGAPTSKTGPVPVPVAQLSQPAAATVPTATTTTSVPASSPTATLTATTSPLSTVSPLTSAVLPANSIDPANIISPTATPASAGEATAQAATASASTPAPQAAGATTTPSQQSQPLSQGDTGSLSAGAGAGTGQGNPLAAAVPPALPIVLANPVKLSIPAISLTDKPVKLVEPETIKLRDGSTVRQWAVPDAAIGVHDSKTGQVCKWGLTALVAHNYWPTAYQPALFVSLGKLKPGDTIEVTDDQGANCSYTVEENRVVNLTEGGKLLSDQSKIADLTRSHLLLYTCTPQFNDNRQMVTAVQVQPKS